MKASTETVSRSMLFGPRVVQVFLLALIAALAVSTPDQHDKCDAWAEAGECEHNAGFMMKGCATACDRAQKVAAALDQELQSIGSFFDLSARDIDGESVDFSQFRGSVIILVNVASYWGIRNRIMKDWSNYGAMWREKMFRFLLFLAINSASKNREMPRKSRILQKVKESSFA
jgi:hypothetical protein